MEKTINECFFQIQNGANIKQGDVEGGFPITRIETTANDKFNRDRMGYARITDISKYEAYVLEDGDLLMSHINSVQYLGRTVLYVKQPDETIIHGMNLLRLKARRNIINPAYARYCFCGHTFRCQIGNITKKSVNQASFAVKDLKQIKMEVPSLDVQNKVVVILDRVQKIIDMRNNALASLDDLIKARFVEMFGDLADPECSWNKRKLIEVCVDKDDIKCGPFGTQLSKDEYMESGIAVWEIPQINIAFKSRPVHFITSEKSEQLKAYTIIPGDIAMSRKGNVGKCAIFPESYPAGIIHSDVLRIRLNSQVVNPMFMMCQLHFSGAVTRQIELVSSGAIMAGVNVTKLKQIYVHIPPIELQNQFADFVRVVDKSKFIDIINLLKILLFFKRGMYYGN